jgi:UDP-glucose:glycoprotein glucosyltransferase
LHINGIAQNVDDVDIFALQAVLHREAATMDQLKALHLPASDIRELVSIPATTSNEQGSQSDAAQFRIDMDIDGNAKSTVTWMNDITVDRRYVSWPPSVQELLAPGWPNQLRYVRKNLYTGVIVMDPTTKEGLNMVR